MRVARVAINIDKTRFQSIANYYYRIAGKSYAQLIVLMEYLCNPESLLRVRTWMVSMQKTKMMMPSSVFSTNSRSSYAPQEVPVPHIIITVDHRSTQDVHVVSLYGKCFAGTQRKTHHHQSGHHQLIAWLRRTISSSVIRLGFGTNLLATPAKRRWVLDSCCYWYIAPRIINWHWS